MVKDTEALDSGVAENHRYKVVQMEQGHFCGYVRTIFRPPWTYDELRGYLSGLIDVHGGLTYGPDEHGWVGFDCAHAGDVCVLDGEVQSDYAMSTRKEWEVEDVAAECRGLARQVDTLEEFAQTFEEKGWGNEVED